MFPNIVHRQQLRPNRSFAFSKSVVNWKKYHIKKSIMFTYNQEVGTEEEKKEEGTEEGKEEAAE